MKKIIMTIKVEMNLENNPELIPDSIKYARANIHDFEREFGDVLFDKKDKELLNPKITVEIKEGEIE